MRDKNRFTVSLSHVEPCFVQSIFFIIKSGWFQLSFKVSSYGPAFIGYEPKEDVDKVAKSQG